MILSSSLEAPVFPLYCAHGRDNGSRKDVYTEFISRSMTLSAFFLSHFSTSASDRLGCRRSNSAILEVLVKRTMQILSVVM